MGREEREGKWGQHKLATEEKGEKGASEATPCTENEEEERETRGELREKLGLITKDSV